MLADSLSTDSRDHRPTGPWRFDAAVAACFPDMIERSIPGLRVLRDLTTDMAIPVLQREKGPRRVVVDLGASRGQQLAHLDRNWGAHEPLELHAVDNSGPMLEHVADVQTHGDPIRPHLMDITSGHPTGVDGTHVTLALFVLQFLPIHHRVRVLARALEHAAPGGIILVAEKIDGDPALHQAHDRHRRGHYDPEVIAAKDEALDGVMVTLEPRATVAMLAQAGWTGITRYWQAGPFVAWAAWRGDR